MSCSFLCPHFAFISFNDAYFLILQVMLAYHDKIIQINENGKKTFKFPITHHAKLTAVSIYCLNHSFLSVSLYVRVFYLHRIFSFISDIFFFTNMLFYT